MKKIIAILLIIGVLISFCSCNAVESNADGNKSSMFVYVEETGMWKIAYHKETKVMYAVSCGTYSHGVFTVLLNADGTPMTYKGDGE